MTNIYSDDIMKYIGYIEIAVGVGLGAGPTLGSIISVYCTYEVTMYVFGIINTVGLLACIFMIPGELNSSATEEEVAEIEQENLEEMLEDTRKPTKKSCFKSDKHNITWWTILSNKHSMFALATCFLGTFNVVFWSGFIANALTDPMTYKMSEDNVGYVFGS